MLFSSRQDKDRFGVIVDIGSGSVLAAIIYSQPNASTPTIIWSRREHVPLKQITSIEDSAKAVMTALMQVLMILDGEGRSALATYRNKAKITEVQYCISAPWSYTITKTITYSEDTPFEVTPTLLAELETAAEQKTGVELSQSNTVKELGLEIVAKTTMDLTINGYQVQSPLKKQGSTVTLAHASVIIQQYLADQINELHKKLFPEAQSKKLSYMLALYCISQDFIPANSDVCLVDVTYEATEIGIVREHTLKYSTHTPFGSFSLAREIAAITGVTLGEAFGYLHDPETYAFINTLPAKQKAEVEMVFEAYIERITKLFHETGDTLSIPKRILIHTDAKTESLFADLIEKAAKRATKTNPLLSLLTSKLLTDAIAVDEKVAQSLSDTAMLSSAQFFHKPTHCRSFEYV